MSAVALLMMLSVAPSTCVSDSYDRYSILLPRAETSAPINASVWFRENVSVWSGPDLEAPKLYELQTDKEVPAQLISFPYTKGTLLELRPDHLLTPDVDYEVIWNNGQGDLRVTFRTAGNEDIDAPNPPEVISVGAPTKEGRCIYAGIEVETRVSNAIVIAEHNGQTQALAQNNRVSIEAHVGLEVRTKLYAIDLAGNRSTPSQEIVHRSLAAPVPVEPTTALQLGCRCVHRPAGSHTLLVLLLLPALIAYRRRL